MGIPSAIGAQEKEPDSLNLLGKLRDFQEINPKGTGPVHPDFNSDIYIRYGGVGLVKKRIQDYGSSDENVFPNDTRNPELIDTYAGTAAFHSKERFQEWYDDRAPRTYQRPFLLDLVFKRNADGLYEYDRDNFFPLDENGGYRNLPGNDLKTFGVLNPCCNHNFGFTMEFHAWFTYLKGKGQVFNFRGDDDTWVYINDSLAIDLGGMHPARSGTVNLDQIAEAYGLKDHRAYMLDFFIAERHVTRSSCKITTSLVLGTRKVAEPVATPGTSAFNSRIAVSLSTATPDAEIHYTLDGRNPDGNSPVYDPSKPFLFAGDAVLKAIGMKPDWNPSEVMTAVYTRNKVPSVLELLDGNGIPLAGRYLTGNDAAYQARVTTTEAGVTALTLSSTTKAGADREPLSLPKGVFANDRFVFTAPAAFPFASGKTAKVEDGTTQSASYDTLRVSWVNPKLAGDSAFQAIPIRPALRQARAWFSTRADGADTVDRYAGTETRIYLVVMDQPLPAGISPAILVESSPRIGSGRAADKEILKTSASTAAGKYVFAIDLVANPAAAPADGKLQIVLEDQIKATYSDPQDSEDPAVANAGFGIAPEIDAVVQFTDAAGAALPAGIKVDPATGSLRLSYSDDWVNGQIASKQAIVTVVNGGGRSPADSESFTIRLDLARRSGSTGVWTGVPPLRGSPAIARGNDTVDTYVLGVVTATVASHGKLGTAGATASDMVQVAAPDKDAALSLEGPSGTGMLPAREDGGLRILLKDQSLSSGRDTLRAELRCAESRDAIASVLLIETDPGTYVSALIPKAEGAAQDDGTLQCLPRDLIKATYQDPVYGTTREAEALLDNPVPMALHFARNADGSDSIGAVLDGGAVTWFYAIVDAQSPSADRTDTLQVFFTTPQGERESFAAVETGSYTHRFVAKIPFAFAYAVAAGNHVVEGRVDPRSGENRVMATAAVSSRGSEAKAEILLASTFIPAARAWIQDRDGDGAADRVCVEFTKPLPRLPGSLSAQWNRGDAGFAEAPSLSFLGDESLIVAADYATRPFPAGLTSIPAGQAPRAKLPMDALFQGQQPVLEDSIGAVILAAEKRPHDLNSVIPNDPSFYHDTVVVTVSEAIKAANDGRQLIKFAISCSEYDKAMTVSALSEPALLAGEPPRYRLIVDNAAGASPASGNCVFLNADPGRFTDALGNALPRHGIELKGRNGDQVIHSMRGFPPVSGLDPNQGSWMAAVQDSRDADARPISTSAGSGWEVLWVPPVGWQSGRTFEPYALGDFSDPRPDARETGTPIAMPADVSSIQVVATSAYVAHITIFDNHGNLVSRSVQAFGGRGELKNLARATAKGMVSWLVWDRKDLHGQLAGQGAYVWKVAFRFATGRNEIRYVRTGLLR